VVSRADLGQLQGVITLATVLETFREPQTEPTASPDF